ncbi:family 43 glycosylhydrolase [Flavobacterium caeni]|uniref:Arabinan endo-1,5-alpha-L-arabinosidase n=1 Tax=Flavobacterium caeni TaxID=490189 RepID=A0A1G5DWX1_9FLAO|nr:family 43 glycosylhydrolase [Flavobacterium caeni]SCY19155.1 arabinan endo-1,5-alpha-L-arabinosidase [Flavobacterium caeni]
MRSYFLLVCLAVQSLMAQEPLPVVKPPLVFNPKNPHVHDPVMIKEKGVYYVFGTGKGISKLYSKDLKTWTEGKPVFDKVPEWTKTALPGFDGDIWAPDIIFHQGQFHLFYACNATPGKPNAAIGHATTPTLDPKDPRFKWTDHGKIIQSILGRDTWQAIDGTVFIDNGTAWLIFGSFWDGIKAVKLTPDLMQLKWPEEWHTIARRPSQQKPYNYGLEDSQIEGAFVYKHGDYYYLFASFDMCCRGINSNYHVVVGRSKSITGPYLDKAGYDMIDGNGTDFAIGDGKQYAALGHNSVYRIDGKDLFVAHAYSIPDDGDSKLVVWELEWDAQGWPILKR